MDLQISDRLVPTRDLLMRSLATSPLERAPAMPACLVDDLALRFGVRPDVRGKSRSSSLTGALRTFLAAPGFGMAAATIVLIAVAIPMLTQPDSGLPETFRGGVSSAVPAEGVRIVLVGANSPTASDLRSSGNFEITAITTEATAAAAETIAGPKVVVNFTTGTITATNRHGAIVHEAGIPASDVASTIADAISRL